jgi:hypothetical protein
MPKLLRLSTDPLTFKLQLSGQSKFLKEQGWEVLLVSADGRMIPQLVAAEGVAHAVIPFVKEVSVIDDFICFWELVQLFKREKPDVVHSHGAKAGFLGMLASSFVGIPHRVHTQSEMPKQAYEGTKEMSLTFREKWTFSKASEVWVNSLGLLNLFTSNELVPAAKLKLLAKGSSNGVDLSRFNRNALQENHLVAATMRMMPAENEFIILVIKVNLQLLTHVQFHQLLISQRSKGICRHRYQLIFFISENLTVRSKKIMSTFKENFERGDKE